MAATETIASMAVNVVGETSGFTGPVKNARHELDLFGEMAHNVTHQLEHLVGAFAAAFAIDRLVEGAVESIHHANEELIELGHSAKRLDITTEAMGGLDHAAADVHISVEDLTKAMTFMEKHVGNNDKALQGLHLSASKLKGEKADEMFLTIAGAIERMPTAAERTAAALAIFGKGGAPMLNLINEGTDKIKEEMAEAERMGLAPTEENLKKLEEEDRQVKKMTESYHALARAAAERFAGPGAAAADFGATVMGADSSGQQAWLRTINAMPRRDFDAMAHELWQGNRTNAVSGKYLGTDVENVFGASPYFDEAIKRRQHNDQIEDAKKGDRDRDSHRLTPLFEDLAKDVLAPIKNTLSSLWSDVPTDKHGNPIKHDSWTDQPGFLNGAAKSLYDSPPAWLYRNNRDAFIANTFGNDAFKSSPKKLEDDLMADPAYVRMSNALSELPIAGDPIDFAKDKHGSGDYRSPGFSAIDANSAEGFRQEAKSRLADAAPDVAREHLTEAKKQSAQLTKIDTSIKSAQKLEIINIA